MTEELNIIVQEINEIDKQLNKPLINFTMATPVDDSSYKNNLRVS